VPPTATATHTLTPPTPVPTAVPEATGLITLTIYFRQTWTEAGFAELGGDQRYGWKIYRERQCVYGDAAVPITDTIYHFVGQDESGQLPAPWRVEFEFAEELKIQTEQREDCAPDGAGFDPKKAWFWVGILDGDSAVGEDNPYSLTMNLYEGNEWRERLQVFFTVADAGGPGGEGGPGKGPPP
jgi:hypothetical protein